MAKGLGAQAAIRRAFERAVMVYDEIATTLTMALMDLREKGGGGAAPDKAMIEAIRAHQKAVLMVVDFEAQLLKRRIGAAGARAVRLDLGAARDEIASRLARLEAAAGS